MKLRWFGIFLMSLPSFSQAQVTLENFLSELRTLQGQFEQKLYNEKGELVETSRGQMFIQRPNKFRWDYQQPYQQLIVADSKKVWIYDKDLDQVSVKDFKKAVENTPALILTSHYQLTEDFFVNSLPGGFELIPKDAQAAFENIKIKLQGEQFQGFELKDNLGQTTVITFAQVQRNQAVEASLFVFTPPAGTDVLEEK